MSMSNTEKTVKDIRLGGNDLNVVQLIKMLVRQGGPGGDIQ